MKKSKDGGERKKSDGGSEINAAPTIVGEQLKADLLESVSSVDNTTNNKNAGSFDEPNLDTDSQDEDKLKGQSPAALLVQEILSPPVSPLADYEGPYMPPTAVEAGDIKALNELDERKIIELREAFSLFDLDRDGFLSTDDLKATFTSLGWEVTDDFVKKMLEEALDPMDFQSFVVLYGIKTIEMDPEEVLLEALSKWDKERTGQISIDR